MVVSILTYTFYYHSATVCTRLCMIFIAFVQFVNQQQASTHHKQLCVRGIYIMVVSILTYTFYYHSATVCTRLCMIFIAFVQFVNQQQASTHHKQLCCMDPASDKHPRWRQKLGHTFCL